MFLALFDRILKIEELILTQWWEKKLRKLRDLSKLLFDLIYFNERVVLLKAEYKYPFYSGVRLNVYSAFCILLSDIL